MINKINSSMKIVKERLFEDIPDSYYQRNFGIRSNDDTTIADESKVVAKVWDWDKKKSSPIVMNPNGANFEEFDEGSRAVIDEYGNLYAAVKDYDFNHGMLGNALIKAGLVKCNNPYNEETSKGGLYTEPLRFIECHYDGEYVSGGESMQWSENTQNMIDKMLEKNPNVELGNDMYKDEYDD